MDIRNWSLDKIMQLPDSCFGRRWPIVMRIQGHAIQPVFTLTPAALPERCVVWELYASVSKVSATVGQFGLRLGDVVPTTEAEFGELELLLGQFRGTTLADASWALSFYQAIQLQNIRVPVLSAGRRIVLGLEATQFASEDIEVIVVISSIPTEVLDCLLSANLRSR